MFQGSSINNVKGIPNLALFEFIANKLDLF